MEQKREKDRIKAKRHMLEIMRSGDLIYESNFLVEELFKNSSLVRR